MDRLPDRILARQWHAWTLAVWLVAWGTVASPAHQPAPDATWEADAALDVERSITDRGPGEAPLTDDPGTWSYRRAPERAGSAKRA